MKNVHAFLSVGLLTFLVSCNNSESSEVVVNSTKLVESNVDTTSSGVLTDELEDDSTISIDLNTLFSKVNSDTIYNVPFYLDSNYMTALEDMESIEKSKLTNLQVQYLSANLIDNTITEWTEYDINSFIEIDSMKMMGTYEEYMNNIDIGMMVESEANLQHKVVINANSFILLWSITYSTYEACPFASGTVVLGTLFNNNVAINTATLGENSGGGDAPYWGETFITSQINSLSVETYKHSENGGEENEETGEEIVEESNETFEVTISDTGFVAIKEI